MDLEILKGRLKEIENAIIQMSNQLNALNGHKAEAEYWINQLNLKSHEAVLDKAVVNSDESPVE
jgi:hypothetical protein